MMEEQDEKFEGLTFKVDMLSDYQGVNRFLFLSIGHRMYNVSTAYLTS